MTKYWALIIAYRPHIFSLGKHNTFEAAEAMAVEFCDKKNNASQEAYQELLSKSQGQEVPEPAPYQLAYIMDESDLRGLTGEVHRPYIIAKRREVVEVAPPVRQGGQQPHQHEIEPSEEVPGDASEV